MNHEQHEPREPVTGKPALVLGEEVFRIQGAIFEVNRTMGSGFLEAVYQECLAIEFESRGIPFQSKPSLPVIYKARALRQRYEPDFVCFGQIILELKAASSVASEHRAQVVNYLKATGLKLGLLVNFGCAPARIDRFVN